MISFCGILRCGVRGGRRHFFALLLVQQEAHLLGEFRGVRRMGNDMSVDAVTDDPAGAVIYGMLPVSSSWQSAISESHLR